MSFALLHDRVLVRRIDVEGKVAVALDPHGVGEKPRQEKAKVAAPAVFPNASKAPILGSKKAK